MSGIAHTHPLQALDVPLVEFTVWNRTGSTLAYGEMAALDLTGSATEVKAFSAFDSAADKDNASPFRNVITLGAAHDDGWPIVVSREPGGIADNASGRVAISGAVDIKVADSLAIGARLSPSSSTATSLVAEADGVAICGILLEANSSGGIAARPVLFKGNTFFGPQAKLA